VRGPGQVVVEVHHASLNRGDLNDARSGRVRPGGVLGSGGVGGFAVQLAALAGAHVIASVGSAARGVGLDGIDQPVDVVLDNVGGPQLVAAWELLAPGGSLQSIGWTSGEPAAFRPSSTVGPPKSLTSFLNQGDPGAELAVLVRPAADRKLTVQIGWRGPLERVAEAAAALRDRRLHGKAVLDVLRTSS
jgi:NADPH:quinone reductase-like Zn-dependent oxidoreductase